MFHPFLGRTFSKAVLMEITIKHVFAINPAAANFTCEFEVNMAWLDAKAKQMPSGTKLDKEKCHVLVRRRRLLGESFGGKLGGTRTISGSK